MRLRWSLRWVLVFALLGTGACAGDSEPDGGREASPDSSEFPRAVIDAPAGTTTTRGLVTTVASRFEFVDYQTSGSAGVAKTLKVWPDGRAACTKGSERIDFSVPAETVTELRRALETANMPALPPVNGTQTPDGTVSRVIFGGESVRYFGGSMPPALGPAVTILDRLLARGCP